MHKSLIVTSRSPARSGPDQAVILYRENDEPFKVELVEASADETVTFYRQGDFIDLQGTASTLDGAAGPCL